MRFMIVVKATRESEAGVMPGEKLMAAMADFHAQLARAGVLLDGAGLHRSREGWRVHYHDSNRRVVDGPFADTRDLIAGYTIIQVSSREEALEWTRRFPNPAGEEGVTSIEVRQLFELEAFAQGEAVKRFRELNARAT